VAIPGTPGQQDGVREVIADLWQLVKDYAKQEMVDPLLMLKKFFAFGIGGALALCLGLGFGTLTIIRALQEQTGKHLTGSLEWVPYMAGFLFALVATALAVWFIKRPFHHEEAPA